MDLYHLVGSYSIWMIVLLLGRQSWDSDSGCATWTVVVLLPLSFLVCLQAHISYPHANPICPYKILSFYHVPHDVYLPVLYLCFLLIRRHVLLHSCQSLSFYLIMHGVLSCCPYTLVFSLKGSLQRCPQEQWAHCLLTSIDQWIPKIFLASFHLRFPFHHSDLVVLVMTI